MAVIKSLGIEVKVVVGGRPAAEYPDTEPALHRFGQRTKTRRCVVEGKENEEFSISVTILPDSRAAAWLEKKRQQFGFIPSLDGGDDLSGLQVWKIDEETFHEGINNFADGTVRNFRFSALRTSEHLPERTRVIRLFRSGMFTA
ncbi:unnamed protein product [Discula destructiva]